VVYAISAVMMMMIWQQQKSMIWKATCPVALLMKWNLLAIV